MDSRHVAPCFFCAQNELSGLVTCGWVMSEQNLQNHKTRDSRKLELR
jgi:hypothetical protein